MRSSRRTSTTSNTRPNRSTKAPLRRELEPWKSLAPTVAVAARRCRGGKGYELSGVGVFFGFHTSIVCFSQIFNEKDEKALLRRWFDHMRQAQPSVYVTYNGDFFDWPFISDRAEKYGWTLYNELGFAIDKARIPGMNAHPESAPGGHPPGLRIRAETQAAQVSS